MSFTEESSVRHIWTATIFMCLAAVAFSVAMGTSEWTYQVYNGSFLNYGIMEHRYFGLFDLCIDFATEDISILKCARAMEPSGCTYKFEDVVIAGIPISQTVTPKSCGMLRLVRGFVLGGLLMGGFSAATTIALAFARNTWGTAVYYFSVVSTALTATCGVLAMLFYVWFSSDNGWGDDYGYSFALCCLGWIQASLSTISLMLAGKPQRSEYIVLA
eukprot:Clim_evm30s206 gene=Clim_evmTU30s206